MPHQQTKEFLDLFCTGWQWSEFYPPTHLQALSCQHLPFSPLHKTLKSDANGPPCMSQHCSDLANETMLVSQYGFQILPVTTTSPTGTHSSWPSPWWSSLGGFSVHSGHSGHTRWDPGLSWGLWAPSGHHWGTCRNGHLWFAALQNSTLEQQTSAESFNPRSKTPPLMTTAATKG